MPKKRKLLTSKQTSEALGIGRSALRLLRLQGQLSTIEKDEQGRSAPAGGFWYDAGEVEQLKKLRAKIKTLQNQTREKIKTLQGNIASKKKATRK